ncbi:uncharacterized, partial [Tachysurus ichikawai]
DTFEPLSCIVSRNWLWSLLSGPLLPQGQLALTPSVKVASRGMALGQAPKEGRMENAANMQVRTAASIMSLLTLFCGPFQKDLVSRSHGSESRDVCFSFVHSYSDSLNS